MTDEQNIDMIAAEYVLGTLPADERAEVALKARHDQTLASAIEAWERRLSPLVETIGPREVPSHIWPLLEKQIDRVDKARGTQLVGEVVDMLAVRRRLNRWRSAAIAASAIAAGLMIFVGLREATRPQLDTTLVAVLQKDAQSPAFLVSVDLQQKQLTIRAVSAPHHPGKSYELWLVHDDLQTPRSLGVIGDKPFTQIRPRLAVYTPQTIEQATLAVSLEPEGGSPTGAPTGPVLYAGKLIQTSE